MSVDIREAADWAAFFLYEEEYFGKQDAYLAQIALIVAATMGGRKGSKLDDYRIKYNKPRPAGELMQALKGLFGGA
jgi:hypothetical protein